MKRCLALVSFLAACGGKSAPTQTAPLEEEPEAAATCKDIGDRAAKDVQKDLPETAPADFGAEFGAMITRLCTDDAWPQEVIDCGMTAEDPREECSPKLGTEQRAHLDEEQGKMSQELMASMSASAGTDLTSPTGMASCDQLRALGVRIASCPAAAEKMGEEDLSAMLAGLAMLTMVPDGQKAEVDVQCKDGLGQLQAVVDKYKCP